MSISGCVQVGEILTGTYGYVDTDNDLEGGTTFQWYRADVNAGAIEGATERTYRLTQDDLGATLQFEVTPKALTGTPVTGPTQKSAPTVTVEQGQAPTCSVLVQGIARVGEILVGSYVYYDGNFDQQGETRLQWYRRRGDEGTDEAIKGATQQDYTVTVNDLGKSIVLAVTPIALTGTPIQGETVKSVPTESVVLGHPPQARAVMIQGIPKVGETLIGTYKYLDHDQNLEGATQFRWRMKSLCKPDCGWVDIEGETGQQLLLMDAYSGHVVAFCVTPVSLTGAPDTGTEVCAYSALISR